MTRKGRLPVHQRETDPSTPTGLKVAEEGRLSEDYGIQYVSLKDILAIEAEARQQALDEHPADHALAAAVRDNEALAEVLWNADFLNAYADPVDARRFAAAITAALEDKTG